MRNKEDENALASQTCDRRVVVAGLARAAARLKFS